MILDTQTGFIVLMRLRFPLSLERQKQLFSGSIGTFVSQLKQESTVSDMTDNKKSELKIKRNISTKMQVQIMLSSKLIWMCPNQNSP